MFITYSTHYCTHIHLIRDKGRWNRPELFYNMRWNMVWALLPRYWQVKFWWLNIERFILILIPLTSGERINGTDILENMQVVETLWLLDQLPLVGYVAKDVPKSQKGWTSPPDATNLPLAHQHKRVAPGTVWSFQHSQTYSIPQKKSWTFEWTLMI